MVLHTNLVLYILKLRASSQNPTSLSKFPVKKIPFQLVFLKGAGSSEQLAGRAPRPSLTQGSEGAASDHPEERSQRERYVPYYRSDTDRSATVPPGYDTERSWRRGERSDCRYRLMAGKRSRDDRWGEAYWYRGRKGKGRWWSQHEPSGRKVWWSQCFSSCCFHFSLLFIYSSI